MYRGFRYLYPESQLDVSSRKNFTISETLVRTLRSLNSWLARIMETACFTTFRRYCAPERKGAYGHRHAAGILSSQHTKSCSLPYQKGASCC